MLDSFVGRGLIAVDSESAALTEAGTIYFSRLGIDMEAIARRRRPICRTCLDWSVRREHLAGGLGAALLHRILEEGWARRDRSGRAVRFTPMGRREFELFPRK